MTQALIAYFASLVSFLVLDGLWLSTVGKSFYIPRLGALLRESPNLAVAGVFYAVYVLVLVIIVILPALQHYGLPRAIAFGALLGLAAYGTYDMTNLSTLRDWPLSVSLVDVAWGTVVTGVCSAAGFLAAQRWG